MIDIDEYLRSRWEDVLKVASITGQSVEDVIEGYRQLAWHFETKPNNWLKMHGFPKRRRRTNDG